MSVAGEIFMEMVASGVVPESAIYAEMIGGYYKGGNVQRLLQYMEE